MSVERSLSSLNLPAIARRIGSNGRSEQSSGPAILRITICQLLLWQVPMKECSGRISLYGTRHPMP